MEPALPSSLKEERTHGSELFHFGYYTADASADSFFAPSAPARRDRNRLFSGGTFHSRSKYGALSGRFGGHLLHPLRRTAPDLFREPLCRVPRLSSLRTCLHFYPMMPHKDGCSDRLQTIHCCCRAASIQQIPALDRCFLNTRK